MILKALAAILFCAMVAANLLALQSPPVDPMTLLSPNDLAFLSVLSFVYCVNEIHKPRQ